MKRITINNLKAFVVAALVKEGMAVEQAEIVGDVLAVTDAYGTHSHGTKNLHNYIRKARSGGVDFSARPHIVREGPAFAVLDAENSMGMIAGVEAMKLACDKAERSGIAIVTVKHSCHFGAVGYYVNLAAARGMIGFAASNVDPNMNAPGAKGKALGNNPLGYASPAISTPSIFLDIALSNVASLKVFQARSDGREIPDNWIVDKDGLPTTDPSAYPEEGAMQPLGAHKGYGLAIFVDLLTGVLNGSATSMGGDIGSWIIDLDKPNNVSHSFLVIDASKFTDDNSTLKERTEAIAQDLRGLPKAKGTERIYTPGEMEWARYHEALKNGILLPDDLLESLTELADELGIELLLL